ncbi:MAG: hypothetical protein U1F53_21530 [Burkholderiaceae bacterium]
MKTIHHLVAATGIALFNPAQATPPLDQPGSLAYSCAGHGNGNAYNGIDQETSFYPGEYKCKEAFDPLGGKVSAKAAYSGPAGGSASSKGQAKWGSLKGQDDSNTVTGEAGRTIIGFNDRWTLNSPTRQGDYAVVTVSLKTVGHIEAHGPSGSSALAASLRANSAAASSKTWAVSTDIYQPDAILDIDETFELSFETNIGKPTMLSTILTAQSGARAAEGIGHALTRASKPGLTWNGIVKVTDYFNQPITDWTLTSDSGIDWSQPCPCQQP